tara:strand:- start:355 stop:504 length:150 start_codon:yes stop_codon:yes gene_type:complete
MALSSQSMMLIVIMLLVVAVGIVLILANSDAISTSIARIFGTINLFGSA